MSIIIGLWAFWELRSYANSGDGIGPDVIVGDIQTSISTFGPHNGEMAFSIGTTSCNVGAARLNWLSGNNQHPVIVQNLHRVKDGRIEQLGMAWLKHGFAVAAGSFCNQCTDPAGSYLGVGCSDPYSSGLNGSQGSGPRSEVNAATGYFPIPHGSLPHPLSVLDGRIRVPNNELNPTFNAGARYFAEAQYVHPEDAAAGNDDNNASYREVFVSSISGGFSIHTSGSFQTHRMMPAILAWQAVYPDVQILNVDVPGDGRIIVGIRTTMTRSGFHNEIAVENLNSDRSARSLTVNFGAGSISNPGFHDVDYQHEPYSGTDWTPAVSGSGIEWSTQTYATNQNANALRWSTLYSFWCDSDARPSVITLGLFKPGGVSEVPIDLTMSIPASNLTVFRGSQTSGSLPDAAESDDAYMSFKPGLTQSTQEAPVWLIFDSNLPDDNPGFLDLVVESNAATHGVFSTTLEAWNWNTGSFDNVDVSPTSINNDTATTVDLTAGISDYVQPGTGAVRARVGWRSTGLVAQFPWTTRLDQLVWKINL